MRRREGQRQLVQLVSPLGQLDSTQEVSCLSTTMEESDMISPTLTDSVDLATGRDRIRAEREVCLSLHGANQLRGGRRWRQT